ncbi:MAG: hypothetical protein ACOYMG_09840, partial [Candidatus Methylumidiphilus sp.]
MHRPARFSLLDDASQLIFCFRDRHSCHGKANRLWSLDSHLKAMTDGWARSFTVDTLRKPCHLFAEGHLPLNYSSPIGYAMKPDKEDTMNAVLNLSLYEQLMA